MAMRWDDTCLYIAARLDETQVWGSLTEPNSVIFRDNDFEVFIDPDGDHHRYWEMEVNALNTRWQLALEKPYRDGGPPVSPAPIAGLRSAVYVEGTLNAPPRHGHVLVRGDRHPVARSGALRSARGHAPRRRRTMANELLPGPVAARNPRRRVPQKTRYAGGQLGLVPAGA